MIRSVGVLLCAFQMATPAHAERVISGISHDTVEVTSSFDGERLTFFGTIAPDVGSSDQVEGPFHVVIVVLGPTQVRVAREKTSNFGIWLNTDQVEFPDFPSYFHVLSSKRLLEVTDIITLSANFILPESHATAPNPAGLTKTLDFGRELIGLMTEEGLFGVQETALQFMSDTFYSAQLTLPGNAPPGAYIAQTYVFRHGAIVARKSDDFAIRKIGFERFLALSAIRSPMLYGIACVLLALITGWLGGLLFKR